MNRKDIPWVHLVWESYYDNSVPPAKSKDYSFWWRDCTKLLQKIKDIATCSLNDGTSILLWQDKWNDQPLFSSPFHIWPVILDLWISLSTLQVLEWTLQTFSTYL
jgi:hypothetical protein